MTPGGTDINRKRSSDFIGRKFSVSAKEHFQNFLGDCIETCLCIIFFKFLDDLIQSFYFFPCLIKVRFYCILLAPQNSVVQFERTVLFLKYRYLIRKEFRPFFKNGR